MNSRQRWQMCLKDGKTARQLQFSLIQLLAIPSSLILMTCVTLEMADDFKAEMADVLGGWQNSHTLTLAISSDAVGAYSEQFRNQMERNLKGLEIKLIHVIVDDQIKIISEGLKSVLERAAATEGAQKLGTADCDPGEFVEAMYVAQSSAACAHFFRASEPFELICAEQCDSSGSILW